LRWRNVYSPRRHYLLLVFLDRREPVLPNPASGLDLDMPVADVMRHWPETVGVFVARQMACPGCPMAPFMTVADAAREYHLDADELLAALVAKIELPRKPGRTAARDRARRRD
jgi:hybrid cluster-associated redox disulfide protein